MSTEKSSVLIAGLKKKSTEKNTFEEKKAQFQRKKALFTPLFILEGSLIMSTRQNVLYLHVYKHTGTHTTRSYHYR